MCDTVDYVFRVYYVWDTSRLGLHDTISDGVDGRECISFTQLMVIGTHPTSYRDHFEEHPYWCTSNGILGKCQINIGLVWCRMPCVRTKLYTMDREVVPRPCKIYDWFCELVLGSLPCTPRKEMLEWPWSLSSPKDITRPTLSIDMFQRVLWWRIKRGVLVEKGNNP
jgi:hypothetical protein